MKSPFFLFSLLLLGLICPIDTSATDLKAAARTFSITPKVGTPASHSRSGAMIENVYGDLKTTIVLMEDEGKKLCFLTSALGVEKGALNTASVKIIAEILKIPAENIISNSSHDHTIPMVNVDIDNVPDKNDPRYLAWELGKDYLTKLRKAVSELNSALQPVTIEYGVAEENRITYNRRGHRLNGKTYFIREEDRMLLGDGYVGTIDPEAIVVVMKNLSGKPVLALTFFSGHPVAAYNPEKMMSYGQFPQVASDKLSKYLGGVPVAFFQGCSGDINAKHMLTGTIEQAQLLGEQLGDSFIVAAKHLKKSKRKGLEWTRETAYVPFAPLPSAKDLQRDLDAIDDFVKRGNAGDENTLECVGMNFPKALTPPYRANLVQAVRPWYVWALEQHKTNNLRNLPTSTPIEISVARFGDVGFVGLPFEPYVKTGLKIKREADLPVVITAGYTDGGLGYIPDASACDDREYQSGYFRYRGNIPPYAAPGADECANVAVKKLAEFAK